MKNHIMAFAVSLAILQHTIIEIHAQEDHLGKVNFQATGEEVAMPYFVKGLLLLHNFEYADAAQEFEMAQLLDPNLVMAFWGEAMCYNHPLWLNQDFGKGKGALFKLGVKEAERLAKAQTEVEKGFISSIELLYGDDADIKIRNEKYELAMADLYKNHSQNEEVAAFYALAILGNCREGCAQEKYDLASRVLMKLNAANPEHPGALNYMIHLNDDPSTAYRGRNVADEYFKLATDSKYALHAPSHIYLANGDWAKLVGSNEASWKSAEAWVKKKKKSLEDRDYHSLWWLQYGYLQQGKYGKALELLTNMNHYCRYTKSERMRFHLAMMRGHYMLESGKWLSDASRIEIPTNGFSVSAKNMCFFVDAMTALEKHDLPKVDWYLNQMVDQRMVEQNKKEAYNDFRTCSTQPVKRSVGLEQELMRAEALEWNLQALKALKTNKLDEAETHIKKAVELEDKTSYEPGPPVILKPAHEIYGEIMLAANNYGKAVEQFDLALQRAPNRSLSLLGKYTALKSLGETQKAAQIKELLMTNWKNADEQALVLVK
jgi:tetratricopeptide (TPR) repeat protein